MGSQRTRARDDGTDSERHRDRVRDKPRSHDGPGKHECNGGASPRKSRIVTSGERGVRRQAGNCRGQHRRSEVGYHELAHCGVSDSHGKSGQNDDPVEARRISSDALAGPIAIPLPQGTIWPRCRTSPGPSDTRNPLTPLMARPPITAPTKNARSAVPGRVTDGSGPAAANPKNTTLPVMLAVNTQEPGSSRRRRSPSPQSTQGAQRRRRRRRWM